MPCYSGDEGNTASAYARGKADSLHDSPVAEMLCQMCKTFEHELLNTHNKELDKIVRWYRDHRERDAERTKAKKQDKEYRRKLAEWEAARPKHPNEE